MAGLVFYPAQARVAAVAASRLADEFEVRKLGPGESLPDAVPVVLLGDADTPVVAAAENVRLIGLLEDGQGPAGFDHWYALLPGHCARPVLARTVLNAFRDLEAAAEIRRLARELSELNAIGIRLSAERDPDVLLELILTKAREITESDAGSLYLVEEAADGDRQLFFALAQNDSLEVPFRAARLPLSSASVAGYVALTGQTVNLPDAYALPADSPFSINRSFDDQTGYRTRSMLVVPMRTPQGETTGVLQLINCKAGYRGRLAGPADVASHVRPFSTRHEALAGSLASQAAVALANNRLYQNIRQLFEGFVNAAVTAIESRDPSTSGHSFRVAELSVALAQVVDRCRTGRYGSLRFSADEIQELRYAALLHDFGKVGVREHVLLKAKKLYPVELERIRHRAALIARDLELKAALEKLEFLRERGRRGFAAFARRLDAELAARLAELDESLQRVLLANEPSVLPRDVLAHIRELPSRAFEDYQGRPRTVVTPREAEILSISRGSLTDEEVAEMRSHVVHTWEFLARIPWTKEFRRIPEIARSHHEKLDGSGYPDGIAGDQIPVQSRIMTIADIYDALTAGDRPYKKAVPAERALEILDGERRTGGIDGDLLDLFIAARVYERTEAARA